MNCRFCDTPLNFLFISLGFSPLANAYLSEEDLGRKESFYPLDVYICHNCFLVQLAEFEDPQAIFRTYAYFSSYADAWLEHAKMYVDSIVPFLGLRPSSCVVEIASNDGYLLQYFVEKNIPVLGIEPAENIAKVAQEKGIPTEIAFFGSSYAQRLVEQGKSADLIVGNNVLAHVPKLNDFVCGLKILLKPRGVITMEFPHLLKLIEGLQFDTIYHEHFSYFSFSTVRRIFDTAGLKIFRVEEIPTHGGSLRIYAAHKENQERSIERSVELLNEKELLNGYHEVKKYLLFAEQVRALKYASLQFFIEAKRQGKKIVGYGAAAKGNTFLNYCGIGRDFLDYTVDKNMYKQGKFLPGTHVPIVAPEMLKKTKPDYIFILAWNLKEEIIKQLGYVRSWGGKFVTAVPSMTVL